MTRIKICGLSRLADVEAVNEARPDYCGFVINFPRSRRNVTPEAVRVLRAELSDGIIPVGVFVDQPPELIADLQNRGIIEIAQLHGQEDETYIARLRELTGGKPVWKAFRVQTAADIEAALASTADRVLLDNGTGTGAAFDWTLVQFMDRPWILAGGLTPENLPEAVRSLRPWGVDLSSGVEADGVKDREKIRAAVEAVRKLDTESAPRILKTESVPV
ncbi:MAG: phosphoribosylanthranilate isomerase [Oscillibacter sp.]|nr:phosphoribosylanthranilate isomerase [Oscillibacter sp.]